MPSVTDEDVDTARLADPSYRESLLSRVAPDRDSARLWRGRLLQLFELEMAYRRHNDDGDAHYENLYWCAFLLYLAGDPSDVPLMWGARHINMDTGCGFDAENMLGAGAEATMAYLAQAGLNEAVTYLRSRASQVDLAQWEASRIAYFYGSQG